MIKNIIAWDLGATKCAAGLMQYEGGQALRCVRKHSVKLSDTVSFADLVAQIEAGLKISSRDVDAVCIGAAGFYDGEVLTLQKPYPYPMSIAAFARGNRWPAYAVIHDYASIVCSTFTSHIHDAENVKRLNTCDANPQGRRVAFGIGTGLGLKDGVLFADGNFWLGNNECGHIGVTHPPLAEAVHMHRHVEIMRYLHMQMPSLQQVTFEKILSGHGLLNLHRFFYPDVSCQSPEGVGANIRAGKSAALLDAFAWYAGLFTGTVQLSFMPCGGVYISGGITQNYLDIFDLPDFAAGLHASPAYLHQRQEYPLTVLRQADSALFGCGYYAVKKLCVLPSP